MPNYVDNRQIKKPLLASAPVWIATSAELERLSRKLSHEPAIAVDTESDSLYSYFEKVCLLQFSVHETDYLVDPLALNGEGSAMQMLAPLFADPNIEKVFHAAEYDILCLKRDYHFEFTHLFDTMIAARILGWKNVGLGNILHERFGITLNKKMQRADWGFRPLTEEQISYAREDTHFLLQLRDLQLEELEKLGRLEEAREQFVRLALVEPTLRQFDPEAYWNIDGARDLNSTELGILRELYRFRDAQARKEDRPPFKVLSDSNLVTLAKARPSSPRALARTTGVPEVVIRRYGTSILSAVTRGESSPQTTSPHPRPRSEMFLDNAARTRLGKLKEWRKERAAKRGVETDVIVSNDALVAIARKNPRTLEALIETSGLGPWKSREYGEELLAVLHGKKK
ncbi:MAG: HRDC domain-containing protein [Chloroflexi bacterium]|nr:HRDC domain-containing protein [Chloroflexota bacterium]